MPGPAAALGHFEHALSESELAQLAFPSLRFVPPQPEAFPDVPSNPSLQPEDRLTVLGQLVVALPAAHKLPPAVPQLVTAQTLATPPFLPHFRFDTISDDWIDDIENLDEYFSQFTQKKRRANAFELRYGRTVMPEGPGWELCERVLSRRDVVERLSEGW